MDQDKELKSPKVSVIIPVYNTEAYLEEAVRSIMNQTLKDLEIIIIDDGSTDNSLAVIKKLAQEDNRIEWLSQPNSGQSVARNVGIERAIGSFIYFMDSDDLLEKSTFELCYKKCTAKQLDFLFFDAENFGELGMSIVEYDRKQILDNRVYKGVDYLNNLLDKAAYRVAPWLYFIKLSFLKKQNIHFDSRFRFYEDQIFTAQIFLHALRVSYIPITLFYRRLRYGSIMTDSYSINRVETYFQIADELLFISKKRAENEKNTLGRLVKEMLNAAIYLAHKFKTKDRIYLGYIALKKYPNYIALKTWIVLLFPQSITIKSQLKRNLNMSKIKIS